MHGEARKRTTRRHFTPRIRVSLLDRSPHCGTKGATGATSRSYRIIYCITGATTELLPFAQRWHPDVHGGCCSCWAKCIAQCSRCAGPLVVSVNGSIYTNEQRRPRFYSVATCCPRCFGCRPRSQLLAVCAATIRAACFTQPDWTVSTWDCVARRWDEDQVRSCLE
jgi:hypothetical protein